MSEQPVSGAAEHECSVVGFPEPVRVWPDEGAPPPNILVVDDNPDNLRLLMEVLLAEGYHVRPALEGELAIAAAQLQLPDLILLDIQMPDLDGYAVCQALKADPRTREVPVVFLTVLDEPLEKVRGFELGGVDYITKPFESAELLARVEHQLRLRSLQQQLVAQRQFLRSIYDNVQAAVSVIDVMDDGTFRIAEVNETFLRMSGLSRSQVKGMNVSDFLPPEHIQRHHQTCVDSRKPVTNEGAVILQGETTWWLSTHSPLINAQGEVYRLIGTSINITERREMEMQLSERTEELSQALEDLRETQTKLIESAKMAALGNLVAGIAHEINTPLGIAVTAASTLENETHELLAQVALGSPKTELLRESLDMVEECSGLVLANLARAGELVQSFKQVAVDQTSLQRRAFDVKLYLQEVINNLMPKIKKTPHQISLIGDSVQLHSWPGALAQVLNNLVVNSLLHGFPKGNGGQLTVEVRSQAKQCCITYHDNGVGISPANLDKIFEPFFTTARHRGGSGLGLHVTYNLVTQRLGGSISVASQLGQGTTFTLIIPNHLELDEAPLS